MTYALEQDDPHAQYRPSGHLLMLMLRASLADDGHGGPWLSVARSAGPRRMFVHHISVIEPDAYTTDRVVLASGVEVLGMFCRITTGLPARVFEPTRGELRQLADWCVTRLDVPLWDRDCQAWLREYMSPAARDRRAAEYDDARARARALRWLLAEEWLR